MPPVGDRERKKEAKGQRGRGAKADVERKKGKEIMGRIRTNIVIDGKPHWTLFDSGARNTYIVADLATSLPEQKLAEPEQVAMGGTVHQFDRICILTALVEDKPVWSSACVVDEIGNDEAGKRIEVLFGALAMQRWGIVLRPEQEELDMSHYSKEFVEF